MKTALLALILLATSSAFAHRYSTFYFATIPPSPAANGRAGIFFGPEQADPLAAWSNPGLLGLMAQTQYASATFYPQRTQWLPGFSFAELTYSARGVFASWPQKSNAADKSWLPLGITYTEQYLNLGDVVRTDPSGFPLSSSHSYEVARSLHFGISQMSPLWRVGIGTGIRYQYSNLSPVGAEGSGTATGIGADVGLWLDHDAVESASRLFKTDVPKNLLLRPSLGFAVTNIGPGVTYDGRSDEAPLPRTARVTMGLTTGIQIQHPDGAPWHLVTMRLATEADDELVQRDNSSDYSYQFPPGDINPLTNVFLGQRNDALIQKKAFELSVFDVLFFREGSTIYDWSRPVTFHYSGWGLSVRGIMRLASHATTSNEISWVAKHIDLQYHESRETTNDVESRDGTEYKGIILSYVR